MNRVCVKNASLDKFYQSGDNDIITVLLHTRMNDYIIDATSKQVIKGNPNKDLNNVYKMTFIRKTGTKTQSKNLLNEIHCPNCGGGITNYTGKCEYCGSIINSNDFKWLLSNFQRITNL